MAFSAWTKRAAAAASLCFATALLIALTFDESHPETMRPDELLVGGGFLGDLPHGGMNGHQNVNNMKALVHSKANQKMLQSDIAGSIMGGKAVSGNDAKAKALAAAAAEIAKVLSAPSAREIVMHQASPDLSSADSDSDNSGSSGGGAKSQLAPWLKTPKDEGRFTYAHKAERLISPCATRHDYECNEEDEASAAHGWTDTPDRSVEGAATYEENER